MGIAVIRLLTPTRQGGVTGSNLITFDSLSSSGAIDLVVKQLGEVDVDSILRGKENNYFSGKVMTLTLKTAEEQTYVAWANLLGSISSNSEDLTKSGLKSLGGTTSQNVLDRARAVLAMAGNLLAMEDFLKAREGDAKAMYEAFAGAMNVVLTQVSKKGAK